jgi:trimeric autotransporter adhesin
MTAATRVGTVTNAGDANATNLVIAMPVCSIGDLLVINLYTETSSAASASGGSGNAWSQVSGTQTGPAPAQPFRNTVFYRLAASGDSGANITLAWGGAGVWRAAIATAWTGVDGTTPVESTVAPNPSASVTATASSGTGVTPSDNDVVLHWIENDYDGNTVTGPTGYTQPTNGDFSNCQVAHKVAGSTAPTGAVTATISAAAWNTGGLLAIKPAVPAGGGYDPSTSRFPDVYGVTNEGQMSQFQEIGVF